ncbi:MAG: HlyD family efflux transporter periplasmic adaptor subunit [Labilithrix sp.]|nr:HlyD family efflux transporter periplasmic adaptor subunit [Labilithrix sp.]MBX3211639.1 HlyD family efflux transporter periplasmic adaptor subunit [Labilithrix sp.]
MRALSADRARSPRLAIAFALVLFGGWLAWFVGARVSVYEVSDASRLETERRAHSVDAPASGRLRTFDLALNQSIAEGDVLAVLDSEAEERRLNEERTRLATLSPEIDALARVLSAHEKALAADRAATGVAVEGWRAKHDEAETSARLASEEAQRAKLLQERGAISEAEAKRSSARADETRAAARARALEVDLEGRALRTRESQGVARIEDLRRELATLEGRRATSRAIIAELEHEIERRTIRAPASGRVEDVAARTAGAWVKEGEKLGVIVPDGPLRVVAEFPPRTSIGRVRAGQPARVRLDGFPWTQYGALGARVVSVASEPRQGHVRIELDVTTAPSDRIPLQHGMTGSTEIEVDAVSPATLVLRRTGQLLERPRTAEAQPTRTSGGAS